ncbi:MAG: D-alanine--D-alanine ligase [Marinifilaceae bacterium]|nr:D-alanine--D-alanine ligase [Marinifilaceae bacterium]
MKNIVVIAGGNSSEHDVSLQSGNFVYSEIDEKRYNKYLMHLRGRDWHVVIGDKTYPVDRQDFSFTRDGEKVVFDFAYPIIHGNPGENGMLQGYLEMMGIPYAGCDTLCTALTFDKHTCNTYLAAYGVKVAPSVLVLRGTTWSAEEIIAEVGLPCFVKPNADGSSFGVSKVKTADELPAAIEKAFAHGTDVLVEAFIDGMELTCGVCKTPDMDLVLPIAKVVPKNEFFDYEAKYDPTMSDEIIPAPIPAELTDRVKRLTSAIYDILRCEGVVRVDYIVRGDEIFMLEVNTAPGMTANSFIPKMVRAIGWTVRDFLTRLIDAKLK